MKNNNFINEIKEQLDICVVIRHYIGNGIKKGNQVWWNCPFHHEKTASFTTYKNSQKYRCFGCGESGDIFNFIKSYFNIRKYKDIAIKLINDFGLPNVINVEETPQEKLARIRKQKEITKQRNREKRIKIFKEKIIDKIVKEIKEQEKILSALEKDKNAKADRVINNAIFKAQIRIDRLEIFWNYILFTDKQDSELTFIYGDNLEQLLIDLAKGTIKI